MTAESDPLTGRRFVTGVIGDDIHVMGIRIVEHALRSAGATVQSLGVMTPLAEFVEAAVETAAEAVVISSSNGHAVVFCEGIREAFTEAGLGSIRLYIGGNLRVGSRAGTPEEIEREFKAMGFDRVFTTSTNLDTAVAQIAADLSAGDEGRQN